MVVTAYAAERARLLLGCYRRADAADPDTYIAAITAVLARYPEDVICAVTHPASGLPIKVDFLPNVREVYLACEAIVRPRREAKARKERVEKQLAERAEFEMRRQKKSAIASDANATNEAPKLPPIRRDSDEAKALIELYAVAHIKPVVSDDRVIYLRVVTPQLFAFAGAPARDNWIWIDDRQQTAAWHKFLSQHIVGGRPALVQQIGIKTGFFAPWTWPPRVDGLETCNGEAAGNAA